MRLLKRIKAFWSLPPEAEENTALKEAEQFIVNPKEHTPKLIKYRVGAILKETPKAYLFMRDRQQWLEQLHLIRKHDKDFDFLTEFSWVPKSQVNILGTNDIETVIEAPEWLGDRHRFFVLDETSQEDEENSLSEEVTQEDIDEFNREVLGWDDGWAEAH